MDAFIRLNYTMPRHRIKVKDICREAPAARSTFYVYYDNVEMLLDDMENAELYEIIRRTDFVVKMPLQEDMMDSCRETLAYIQEKKRWYYAFLVQEPNTSFIRKWKNAIKQHLRERIEQGNLHPKNTSLVLEILASEVISIYTFFLTHPYEVDQDDLGHIAVHALELLNT